MDSPHEITIHGSLDRPRLILGADRELVLSLGLISAILVFALVTWWGVTLGIFLWLAGVSVLVRLGKVDPLMRHVYLRHVKYQPFYPAKAAALGFGVRLPRAWR
jgi:type IV secretion system protein VirB3